MIICSRAGFLLYYSIHRIFNVLLQVILVVYYTVYYFYVKAVEIVGSEYIENSHFYPREFLRITTGIFKKKS